MEYLTPVMLFIVGILGGIVSTVAGGASLVTYPVLILLGLSPLVANATNSIALSFSGYSAVYVERRVLPLVDRAMRRIALVSAIGVLGGALLLVGTGEARFRLFVPLLLGFATLLYAAAPTIQERYMGATSRPDSPGLLASFFGAAIYSGYFGTGYGVVLLGLFRLGGELDFLRANRMKNILGCVVSAVLMAFLATTPLVHWRYALIMAAGNIAGGVIGARLARVLPARLIRWIILISGGAMTVVFAWRYWFS